MPQPTPAQLRTQLAALDERQRKIVAGVLALLIRHPDRAREREWVTEQFTQVVLLAGGCEGEPDSAGEAIDEVRAYARTHVNALLNASYALFQQVALDMAPRAADGFTFEEAMAQALGYFETPSELN